MEGSMSRPGDGFVGDALLGTALLGAALAASVANYARQREEQDLAHLSEWEWVESARYWRERALRAERALAAAEARLDELD
jgi:hypothetical protein